MQKTPQKTQMSYADKTKAQQKPGGTTPDAPGIGAVDNPQAVDHSAAPEQGEPEEHAQAHRQHSPGTGASDAHSDGHAGDIWIVESKLAPSRPNVHTVQRERLMQVLDEALSRKLALVTAPAGFGKSTLLQQWHERTTRNGVAVAWFSPDEADADPHQFLAYVVLALTKSGLAAPDIEVGAHNGFSDSPTRSVLRSLIAHMRAAPIQRILIIDDYHRAASPAVDEIVKVLLREAPQEFSLIVSGREPAALDIPLMVATGEAVEIGADHLRLTKQETTSAMGDASLEPASDDIFDQTEGWPVAVQLALVQRRAHPGARIEATASRGVLAAYLTDQVLSGLDDDARDFLLSVSVLERFNPDLANAVHGTNDSWRVLAKLQPLTALIIPLDVEGDWYRLHHLFAEYLRKALLERYPARFAQICLRASAWQEERGYAVEAVKYAAMAKDYETCIRIILDAGGWRIIINQSIGQLRGLLRPLPRAVIDSHWALLLARAYLHCKDGETIQARALFDAGVAKHGCPGDPATHPDLMTMHALIAIYDETLDWRMQAGLVGSVKQAGSAIDPLEAGTLECMDVLVNFAMGDLDAAQAALHRSFVHWRQSGVMIGFNYAYLHGCVAALYRADFHEASANVARALELAAENFGSDSGLKHIADVLNNALGSWRGQLTADDSANVSRILSYIEEFDSWCEIFFLGFDAAASLALQTADTEAFQDIAQRLRRVSLKRGLGRLDVFVDALELQAAYLAEDHATVTAGCPRLLSYMARINLHEDPHEWQSIALSLCLPIWAKTATERHDDGQLGRQALEAIETIKAFATHAGAQFHAIRLDVSRAGVLSALHRKDEALSAMKAALFSAARQGMAGPFLVSKDIHALVRAARDDLRLESADAVTLNFVTDVLARCDALSDTPSPSILTPREREIIERLALGETNKHIARRFDLTENTVKFHLKNIFAKLNVSRRGQAIAVARELELID